MTEEEIMLLLVDDEAEIRTGLRNLLDWKALGIHYLKTAGNGAEALDMIRYYDPDIVITDIQMPGMNGLDLMKYARSEQFNCLFVILSGYDDFHYAQTAIRQGVNDYILKPVAVEELTELIKRLTAEVLQKRSQQRNQVKLSRRLNAANKTITQQNFIAELLREELSPAQIDAIIERDGIPLRSGQVAAVVLHIYEQTGFEEGGIALTLKYLNHYYSRRPAIFGHINRSSIIIFHNTDSLAALYDDTKQMLTALKSEYQVQAFGAIGTLVDSLRQVHESFRMANQVASWHIFPEMGLIADTLILSSVGTQNLIKDNRILQDIKSCNMEAIKQDFEAYTDKLFFTPFPPPAYLFSMYNLLIMDIRSQLSDSGPCSYSGDAYQAMRQFDTFGEVKEWVLSILMEFATERSVHEAKIQDPLIQKAVEYIADHIFHKVRVEDVCNYMGYSKSYFSKYFRQKTNLNFRDYILDMKITYAGMQLKTNAHTPKELALMLGYEEYSSFSRAFKTRTGFSPSDYQKSFH